MPKTGKLIWLRIFEIRPPLIFVEYLPTKSKSVKIFITFSYRAVHTVLWQTQCNEGWASWLFIITAYICAEECKTLRWTYLGSNLWNEMSQRSHVTWILPYRCSLRQVDRWEGIYECSFFLVRSCLLVNLIKCLKVTLHYMSSTPKKSQSYGRLFSGSWWKNLPQTNSITGA